MPRGSGLESIVIASSIGAYWFNILFKVIGDAEYPDRSLTEEGRGTALEILTNFVDIVNMTFVESDCPERALNALTEMFRVFESAEPTREPNCALGVSQPNGGS